MIPKIAHFVWYDDARGPCEGPSSLRRQAADSFERLNPDWVVSRRYEQTKCPPGLCLANIADMDKYKCLEEHGGVAFDTDIVFHRPFPDEYLDGDIMLSTGNGAVVSQVAAIGEANTGFFHEAVMRAMELCEARGDRPLHYQALGVLMLTELIELSVQVEVPGTTASAEALCSIRGLELSELPYEAVIPYPPYDIAGSHAAVRGGECPDDSIGVHWYGGHDDSRLLEDWWVRNLSMDERWKQNEWCSV